MDSTRREFMVQAGAAVVGATTAGAVTPEVLAFQQAKAKAKQQQPQVPTIITVYLRGGADALAVIPPHGDKRYPEVHPTIAVPSPDSSSQNRALPLDNTFSFNPNMKELYKLYQNGMCVPIVCVGSPHATRSHFDAQDFMERGAPGLKFIATGWLNRYLQATRTSRDANLRALSLQSLLPRSLRGDYPVLAKPEEKADQAMAVYSQLYPSKGMDMAAPKSEAFGAQTRKTIVEFGARTIEQLAELNQILEKSPPPSSGVKYPEGGFGRQLRDIAKVIKANRGLEVTALDIGGWDHHTNEGPVNGTMARMLTSVSGSIGAFVDDLGPKLMENVLILVMTEFGRTVKENGNRGTDHGHGGFMLVVGGKLNGKKVYGKWTGLEDNKLYEARDLPVHTDFRVVFADCLKGLFKFDGIKAGLFPEYTSDSPPLDLMHA